MSGTASQQTRATQAHSIQALACEWASRQPLANQSALFDVQQKARAQLQALAFPERKTEVWKYTGFAALD